MDEQTPQNIENPGTPEPVKKAGRPVGSNAKKMKTLKIVKALLTSKRLADAYLKEHPKSSPESASKNAYRWLNNEEVMSEFKKQLNLLRDMKVNRDVLEQFFMSIIVGKFAGTETTQNAIAAARELTRLVEDFKDRSENVNKYEKLSDSELDAQIKRFIPNYGEESKN